MALFLPFISVPSSPQASVQYYSGLTYSLLLINILLGNLKYFARHIIIQAYVSTIFDFHQQVRLALCNTAVCVTKNKNKPKVKIRYTN